MTEQTETMEQPLDQPVKANDMRAPAPAPNDIDVVIGLRGPIAPPQMCNGLMVPIVVFDQIYSFGRDALIKAIPKPEKMTDKQFNCSTGSCR